MAQGSGTFYNVTAILYVTNQYGAYARTTAKINVKPLSVSIASLSSNITSLLSTALSSYSTETVFQIVGATSSGLSTSSCTNATLCNNLRSTLLTYVSSAVSQQDASASTVLQQAQALESLTSEPSALTDAAQTTALTLISTISSRGTSTGISDSAFSSLGGSLSSILQTSAGTSTSNVDTVSDTLNSIIKASWVNLKPGESGQSLVKTSLNMTNSASYASKLTNQSFSPPGTTQTLTMPSEGASSFYSSVSDTDEFTTSVSSMAQIHQDRGGSNATSNLVRFGLTQSTSSTSDRRRRLEAGKKGLMSVKLRNKQSQSYQVTEVKQQL